MRNSPRRAVCLRIAVAALGLTLLAAGAASAQPEVAVTASARIERSDQVAQSDETGQAPAVWAEFAHAWDEDRTRLFYRLDTGTFATPGDWLYHAHQAGVLHRFDLRQGVRRLYVGAQAILRANGGAWADAGYGGISAFSNLEFIFSSATFRTGYRYDWRDFPDYQELSQQEHTGFASLLANLPSRTTLIGEAVLGGKRYGVLPYPDVPATLPELPTTLPTTGRGQGMGPAFRVAYGTAPHGLVSPDSGGGPLAGQVTLFGRVAQSLADRTSVLVDVSRRQVFGDLAPAVVATPELFFDDGVYDDPYASNAWTWRAGTKHVFAGGAALEAGLTRAVRDYTSTIAVDATGAALPGSPLRQDRAWRADGALTVPLWPSRTGAWDIDLVASVLHVDQASNDAYYDYRSTRVALGMSLGY